MTNVKMMNQMVKEDGIIRLDNTFQSVPGYLTVFPVDYFFPYDNDTREMNRTERTVAMHHYDASWVPKGDRVKQEISFRVKKAVGKS